MVYRIADNIVSPLGMTTAENYRALKAGHTALRHYSHQWGLPEPFTAALFSQEQTEAMAIPDFTRFESLVIHSIQDAIQQVDFDVTASNVIFILSTTKANIELLSQGYDVSPATAVQHIAQHIGFTIKPIVVCNACISGVSAIMLAQRLLEAGTYDYAIVCGADVQNVFTISGFQSLKAVSEQECRPFDIERIGLNLGEAASTIIFQRDSQKDAWAIECSAVRNDCFHISSPSKDGNGAFSALKAIHATENKEQIAFINAHGTATMFNDQMESVAIERAGLSDISVNALKGYLGHTLGAAGILETVISIAAIEDHTVLCTRGFEEYGVSGKMKVTTANETTEKQAFIKMISGFGGGNGALLVTKHPSPTPSKQVCSQKVTHRLTLTPKCLRIDNNEIALSATSTGVLTDLYKQYINDYPKYYKMDGLSRLGFIAAELLLKAEGAASSDRRSDRAIILFNHSSSIAADLKYQESINDTDNFFPSPSVFVYTLPNIVTGEIAIRHQYCGETSFYILPDKDEEQMKAIIHASFGDIETKSMLTGWVNYDDKTHFEAELNIIEI